MKWMIENVIREAHKAGAKVGLCGQAPSDHPEFAGFLVRCGIIHIREPRQFHRSKTARSRCRKRSLRSVSAEVMILQPVSLRLQS